MTAGRAPIRPLRIGGDETRAPLRSRPSSTGWCVRSTRRTPRSRAHASPIDDLRRQRRQAPITSWRAVHIGMMQASSSRTASDGPVAHVSGIVVTAGLAGASRAHVTVAGRTLSVTPARMPTNGAEPVAHPSARPSRQSASVGGVWSPSAPSSSRWRPRMTSAET